MEFSNQWYLIENLQMVVKFHLTSSCSWDKTILMMSRKRWFHATNLEPIISRSQVKSKGVVWKIFEMSPFYVLQRCRDKGTVIAKLHYPTWPSFTVEEPNLRKLDLGFIRLAQMRESACFHWTWHRRYDPKYLLHNIVAIVHQL